MEWQLTEAIAYYRSQGAPADQNALVLLLKEIQQQRGGIPRSVLGEIASAYGIKEALLLALIRRIPSLRLSDTHLLELCAGPNCPKRADLAGFAQKAYGSRPGLVIKQVPCMRLCGKGPNIRYDGKVYHRATEDLIRRLVEET